MGDVPKRLAAVIDEAGRLKAAADEAASAASEAKKRLRKLMCDLGITEARGAEWESLLVDEESLSVSPMDLARVLHGEALYACMRVNMEAARAAVPEADLRRVGKVKRSSRLELREID